MAPKAPRKASISARDSAATGTPKTTHNTSMPPPPVPVPSKGILEPEVDALGACLRSAVVKTGQIYRFYSDAKKLGIQQYASRPPRSLTASLGREVEKYDQLCDAIETRLQRAMAVLQRDIHREEQRLEAEAAAVAAAAAKAAAEAEAAAISSPMISPTSPSLSNPLTGRPAESSPDSAHTKALPTPARRQSTVSLSSLQRPNFQHRLDLSGTSMRIHTDELLSGIPSGLSSPVTLAPKSSHRAIPQELVMAALTEAANRPVDIDLTVSEAELEMQQTAGGAAASLDPTAGTSADKPIELDLDMDMDMDMDLFDAAAAGSSSQHIFNPHAEHPTAEGAPNMVPDVKPKQEEDFFPNALHAGNPSGDMGDILASLGGPSAQDGHTTDMGDSGHPPPMSSAMKAPSPQSILASFDAAQQHPPGATGEPNQAHFDIHSIDLESLGAEMFDVHQQETGMSMSEMENLFNIDAEGRVIGDGSAS